MTRFRLAFLAPFLSFACGGDDGTGDDSTTSPTAPGTMDDGGSETAAPDDDGGSETAAPDDDGGSDTTGTPGEPGPPEIVSVAWTNVDGCEMGMGSDVEFAIEVTDPDNDVSELTFSGMAIGCTGTFDGPMVTLFCPNAATYNATVEVADPDGNEDDLDIMFAPCVDGSAP